MLSELLAEAFEVDGRIVRSLKLLFFKPGQLTAEFSADRRVSYVSPIRLYLFASLLFFFLVSVFSEITPGAFGQDIEVDVDSMESISRDRVEAIESHLDEQTTAALEQILANRGSIAREIVVSMMDPDDPPQSSEDTGVVGTAQPMSPPEIVIFSAVVNALSDPARFLTDLLDNAPLAMFLLLPAYALLLKLVYVRKGVFYVEHFVFALHLHSFIFLVNALLLVLPDLGDLLGSLTTAAMGLYYWLALKRYYRSGWFSTTVVLGLLSFSYFLLLIPATLLVTILTVAMN